MPGLQQVRQAKHTVERVLQVVRHHAVEAFQIVDGVLQLARALRHPSLQFKVRVSQFEFGQFAIGDVALNGEPIVAGRKTSGSPTA